MGLLFNVLLTDLEDEMGNVKWGEVNLGEGRIWTMAYADDLMELAENKEKMRERDREIGKILRQEKIRGEYRKNENHEI